VTDACPSNDSAGGDEARVSYPARPPGVFPSLASIKDLPREERSVPLEAWVVWVNANRGRMNPEWERLLDETLRELEELDVPQRDFEELGRRFDEWLDSLDQVPRP
jgi:hypothetical protein